MKFTNNYNAKMLYLKISFDIYNLKGLNLSSLFLPICPGAHTG